MAVSLPQGDSEVNRILYLAACEDDEGHANYVKKILTQEGVKVISDIFSNEETDTGLLSEVENKLKSEPMPCKIICLVSVQTHGQPWGKTIETLFKTHPMPDATIGLYMFRKSTVPRDFRKLRHLILDVNNRRRMRYQLKRFAKFRVLIEVPGLDDMSDSDQQMYNAIQECLKELRIEFVTDDNQTEGVGQLNLELKHNDVRTCDRLLYIVSPSSAKNVTFASIKAVQKCITDGHLHVTIVKLKTNEQSENEKQILFGLMELIYHHNSIDWSGREHMNQLLPQIKDRKVLAHVLPWGNLEHALSFSHFFGYQAWLYKRFREKLEGNKVYQENRAVFPIKFFELIPVSNNIRDVLVTNTEQSNELGFKIEFVEDIGFTEHHHGKVRTFKITIYRITNRNESPNRVYYFCGGFPPALSTIKALKKCTGETSIKDIEYKRYLHMFGMLAYHTKHIGSDIVELLKLDKDEKYAQTLFTAIERALGDNNQDRDARPVSDTRNSSSGKVLLLCSEHNDSDRQFVMDLYEFLKNRMGSDQVMLPEANRSPLHNPDDIEWIVMVISRDTIRDNLNSFINIMILHEHIEGGAIGLIPILRDMDPSELPWSLDWITFLQVESDPNYQDKLLNIIRGERVKLENQIPAGDVGTGLALGYATNYLPIQLHTRPQDGDKEFEKRVKRVSLKLARRETDPAVRIIVLGMLFIVWPRSCKTSKSLAGESGDYEIEKVECKPAEVLQPSGGQHNRYFNCELYELKKKEWTGNKERVVFLCEYCSPAACLFSMIHDYSPIAGLRRGDLMTQGRKFQKVLNDVIYSPGYQRVCGDVTDMLQIVYVNDDDESINLHSEIGQAVERELINRPDKTFTEHGSGYTKKPWL